MKFDEIVKNRYSVREYQDKIVEKNLKNQILESGRIAPTAGCENSVIVYNLNENQIQQLKLATHYTFDAKNMFIICYDDKVSYKSEYNGLDFGIQDAAIVTTHMMLKITDLGLGSCWVGSFDAKKVIELFNFEENIIPVALLPFGYTGDDCMPSQWHLDRKPMNEFAIDINN